MNEKPTKKIIKTQKSIENLIIMMKKHRIDCLKIEGVEIFLSRHELTGAEKKVIEKAQAEVDDETLFWSATQ